VDKAENKEYSWAMLTASGMVTALPCELICIDAAPSAANAELAIYDGIDAAGTLIHTLFSSVRLNFLFAPIKPVECEKGIYIAFTANVTRVFVQYRNMPRV